MGKCNALPPTQRVACTHARGKRGRRAYIAHERRLGACRAVVYRAFCDASLRFADRLVLCLAVGERKRDIPVVRTVPARGGRAY